MAFIVWPTVGANSYISVATADSYLAMSINASEWSAASTTTKQQALVSATRMLDRTQWTGAKVASTQPLEWPRTGVTDRDGAAVSSSTIPQQIQDATAELALALTKDVDFATSSEADQVKTIKTAETTVTFALSSSRNKYSMLVKELVAQFFASGTLVVPYAPGTDEESVFEDADRFDYNEGLA